MTESESFAVVNQLHKKANWIAIGQHGVDCIGTVLLCAWQKDEPRRAVTRIMRALHSPANIEAVAHRLPDERAGTLLSEPARQRNIAVVGHQPISFASSFRSASA